MSALRRIIVEVSEDLARRIDAEVASGVYDSQADLVVDSLEAHFDEPVLKKGDPDVDRWLREEVGPTYDAYKAEPSRLVPEDEAAARVAALVRARTQLG